MKKKQFQKNAKQPENGTNNPQIVLILFLSFFILSFVGAGSFIIVSLVGLLLCMVGLMQGSVKVDLWVLLPLIFYNLLSLISGYRTYGSSLEGLASTQWVFPVIYLLSAYLDAGDSARLKTLCAVWVGLMAAIGIGQFTAAAFSGTASRLAGIMGNPNAMGAMLAFGWFALQSCIADAKEDSTRKKLLTGLAFIVLCALALTLSFGAFGALAVGVVAMQLHNKGDFSSFIRLTAEIIFAGGCGVLLYIAGDLAASPLLCVLLCAYILAAAFLQDVIKAYFAGKKWLCAAICLVGVGGAAVLLYLRPNAAATFTERLAMIKNGLSYLGLSPLIGVGPYQWRALNMVDADTYFNTWHIHNVFVHVGVELGLPAMALLIIAGLRHFRKREDSAQRAEFFAALIHNLMDTSFFYVATLPFLMMTLGRGGCKTRSLGKAAVRGYFGISALFFAWNTVQCLL